VDVSIIIPVYNGEETIKLCLDAVSALKIPDGMNIEVLVVNDGSTDRTKEITASYSGVTIIDLEKNMGRMQARKIGAEKAKYENLFLIDTRIEVDNDLLVRVSNIGYQPLMAGDLKDEKYKSDYDTLLYLIRRKFYHPYYPQILYAKELWITKEKFLKAPKGTGCLLIDRELFLKSIPQTIEKDSNDDTTILKNIVFNNNTKILRHTDLSIKYHSRSDNQVLSWINHRGKTFADHYLRFINKFSIIYYFFLMVFLLLFIFHPLSLVFLFFSVLILSTIYLQEDKKDFVPLLKQLPLLGFMFFLGTLEKLFKIIFKK
jgi:glycosyltransferase involved in cell wall biosynthesis